MELREEIVQKIIERGSVIFKKEPSEINTDTNFIIDLKAKSGQMVYIISALETEYDVEINFAEVKKKKTIGELADYVVQLCIG